VNPSPDRLLRTALRGNAAFSSACGASSIVWSTPLGAALGIDPPFALVALGAQLLAFALFLAWLASRESIPPAFALSVVAADALWVIGTIPILVAGLLTTTGSWTAFAIANVVACFAVVQYAGVRRLRSESATHA